MIIEVSRAYGWGPHEAWSLTLTELAEWVGRIPKVR